MGIRGRKDRKIQGHKFCSSTNLSLILLVSLLFTTSSAWGQPINPVTPTPERPQPQPLPSLEKPLQTSPTAPPTPDEIQNVPGTIVVQKFEFVGSTVFSQQELEQATANFVGKSITFAELLQAANQITQLYLQQGYITSGAYIPSQEIQSGIVKIQVLEGSLEDIKVNIVKGRLNSNYVRDRIAVAGYKPLNINRLQESLQLLQLNPRIEKLNAELTSGTKPGTNLLEVTVIGADTFNTRLILNNHRNPSIGSFERGIEISETSLLGLGDEFTFGYRNTDGSNRFEGSYNFPVNPRNGTIGFTYRITKNKIIEPPFDELDIKIDSREYELTFRQPVIQKATPKLNQELTLSFGFARRETNSSLLGVDYPVFSGADSNGETRISELNFTQEWLQRSSQAVLAVNSEISLGISAFNASVSDDEPDSQFLVWRGQMLYLRRLGQATPRASPSLLLRSSIQLASDSLVPIEQFSIGGSTTVRGYRQDALVTDNGVILSLETRLPIFQTAQAKGTLQIAPFIDFGIGWNTGRDNPDPNTLVSLGCGLLWQMGEKFSARLDWGIPLVDISDSEGRTWQENGVYFQLEYKP
ncbi:MAG: ShlB/FhaC/HecB family hemolysin secretion/activation protein [Nostochopsis sp.]